MNGTTEGTALIATDVQGDFLPGGSLAVAHGDEVVEPLVKLAARADLVVATRDFHPRHHVSFTERGGPWPVHCVAGSAGAVVHPEIDRVADLVVSKGMHHDRDAYSAFDGTGLAEMLRACGMTRLLIGGLATDYCVRATSIDAVRAGFDVTVVKDAVRAVDVEPGDGDRALAEMEAAGVRLVPLDELLTSGG